MARANGNGGKQSEEMMRLIREATALQVEMLGAAARVWSEIVERVADYNRELTNQMMRFSGGEADANEAVGKLIKKGRDSVKELVKLPDEIGKGFKPRVEKRAGHAID